ncbi:hypothetical protein GCM10023231_00050 [Olivibacter ginsenosidimutans]|uniref:UspA domain-containing protein n=2 Tax=Olivibacter ginsenosidimutans TaxID=1176537 RepID=A0ABP9AD58_9SPHI
MTDLAEGKENVLHYAVQLASQLQAVMVLTYVEEGVQVDREAVMHQLDALSVKLREWAPKTMPKPLIKCRVEDGDFNATVKELITELKVDLVIMGATDGKNHTGYLFGNKVRAMVEHITYPLLLIPEQVHFQPIKNILYVSDVRYMKINVINELIALARPLGSHVAVLHVSTEGLPDMDDKMVRTLFVETISHYVKNQLPSLYNSNKKEAESTIDRLTAGGKEGILAIDHRKYHFFNHLFTDNPSENAQIYKHLPLLLIPI